MFDLKALFDKEPVAIAGAVIAMLNVGQLLGVISLDADALAGINTAMVAVLSLFVRSKVSPVA